MCQTANRAKPVTAPDPANAWHRRHFDARARKLVADANYPSKKVMQAVADLLARKLGSVKRET